MIGNQSSVTSGSLSSELSKCIRSHTIMDGLSREGISIVLDLDGSIHDACCIKQYLQSGSTSLVFVNSRFLFSVFLQHLSKHLAPEMAMWVSWSTQHFRSRLKCINKYSMDRHETQGPEEVNPNQFLYRHHEADSFSSGGNVLTTFG